MFNRKKAFSLMELLLIIVVLGIIASLFIKMVRVDNITTKYTTYAAWQNIYNIVDELQNDERAAAAQVSPVVADDSFCKASARLVSTIDEIVNCDVANIPSTPNYTFSNGIQIFGLQPNDNTTPIQVVNTNNANPQGHYRTVFIDLNGISDPDAVDNRLTNNGNALIGNINNMINSDVASGTRNLRADLPDIIAFRIYNDYQSRHHASVVPIGIAANDRRYLTARVKITNSNTGEVKFDPNAYTYRGAECAAFGASRSDTQYNSNGDNADYPGATNCGAPPRLGACTQDGVSCELVVSRPSGAF